MTGFSTNYCVRQNAYFSPAGSYDVPRVLIADVRSFQAFAAILNRLTHVLDLTLVSNRDYLKLVKCEIQKYEVLSMSVAGGQPRKKKNTQSLVIKQQNTSNALHFTSRQMT